MAVLAREGSNEKRGLDEGAGGAQREPMLRPLLGADRSRPPPSNRSENVTVKRLHARSKAPVVATGIGYSWEFLERIAHILVQTGHSPKKLSGEFREICMRLKEPAHAWNPAYLNLLADLPHVIARWHADPRFVDSKGAPVALPLKSRQLSLTSLVARVLPAEDPHAVIDSLIRLRGIRRRGRLYVPTDRQLRLTREHGRVHGLMALLGILRTIDYNVSRATPGSTILERAAVNPHFPVQALPAFHGWLKGVAGKFLWDADDKMRRREARWKSEPTTRLGVAVFAFEDPSITGTQSERNDPRQGRGRIKRLGRAARAAHRRVRPDSRKGRRRPR